MLWDAFVVFSNYKGLKGQPEEIICADEPGTFLKPILLLMA
jgi:hypothetical protein